MGTGFLDRANLDWHLTPGIGPENVSRAGVKQQGPFQVPLAKAECTGSLVMHCPQGLGPGVLCPLSTLWDSSSLPLTVRRALRHTQAPGRLLLGMHRPACVPALGPGALTPLTALFQTLHSSQGRIWGPGGPAASCSFLPPAQWMPMASRLGYNPAQLCLTGFPAPRAGLDPCFPPLRQDGKVVLSVVSEFGCGLKLWL